MSLNFKPAIWTPDGTLVQLPRPITRLEIGQSWDYLALKVPLEAREHIEGRSANGPEIIIEGKAGKQAGDLKLTEQEMFNTLEAIRAAADHTDPDNNYELFIYHDSTEGTYRSLRSVTTIEFRYEIAATPQLFSYRLHAKAANPQMFNAAPS